MDKPLVFPTTIEETIFTDEGSTKRLIEVKNLGEWAYVMKADIWEATPVKPENY